MITNKPILSLIASLLLANSVALASQPSAKKPTSTYGKRSSKHSSTCPMCLCSPYPIAQDWSSEYKTNDKQDPNSLLVGAALVGNLPAIKALYADKESRQLLKKEAAEEALIQILAGINVCACAASQLAVHSNDRKICNFQKINPFIALSIAVIAFNMFKKDEGSYVIDTNYVMKNPIWINFFLQTALNYNELEIVDFLLQQELILENIARYKTKRGILMPAIDEIFKMAVKQNRLTTLRLIAENKPLYNAIDAETITSAFLNAASSGKHAIFNTLYDFFKEKLTFQTLCRASRLSQDYFEQQLKQLTSLSSTTYSTQTTRSNNDVDVQKITDQVKTMSLNGHN